jgi:hypothetical protein
VRSKPTGLATAQQRQGDRPGDYRQEGEGSGREGGMMRHGATWGERRTQREPALLNKRRSARMHLPQLLVQPVQE